MVVIKDMKMPSDCMGCPFCNHLKNNDYGSYGDCAILGDKERMNLLLHEKHSDCPLAEIVTCKDCKHCHQLTKAPNVWFCEKHNCVSKNFYCADAERRE